MKKWWVVVFALAFVVSITTPVLLDAKGKEPAITKVEDYIELDANSVKFLFRTEPGTVKFYLGENPRKLAMVKQENRYDYRQGLVIDGLQPGRKYYYKVKAAQGSSPVHSFVKLGGFDADKKAEWARTSVFYFVYLRSFYDGNGDGIGDFIGLKEKLGYLKDLGIDAVWILPCFLSVGVHGYDILDYKQIRRDYGGMEAYREFLKEARKQGIKVVLDLVVNHTSYMNRWFSQAKYPDNEEYDKYRNFYVWADRFDNTNLAGPWGQKVWFNNGEDDYYAVFGSNMPDLNFRYPGVREEIKKWPNFGWIPTVTVTSPTGLTVSVWMRPNILTIKCLKLPIVGGKNLPPMLNPSIPMRLSSGNVGPPAVKWQNIWAIWILPLTLIWLLIL